MRRDIKEMIRWQQQQIWRLRLLVLMYGRDVDRDLIKSRKRVIKHLRSLLTHVS